MLSVSKGNPLLWQFAKKTLQEGSIMSDVPVRNDIRNDKFELLEKVLLEGDLSKLTPQERLAYANKVCETLGLNPFTKPFDYIRLNGRLVLYAKKDATDQLRKIHGISIRIVDRQIVNDEVYVVTAKATDKEGRTDESIGAVSIKGLTGDALANALMKAETKAKRRVTLSICGLGFLDESELDTIQDKIEIEPVQPAEIKQTDNVVQLQKKETTVEKNDSQTTTVTTTPQSAVIELHNVAILDDPVIMQSKKGTDYMKMKVLADEGEFEIFISQREFMEQIEKGFILSKVTVKKLSSGMLFVASIEE